MLLAFASSNLHKIDEIRKLLPPHIQLKGLSELGIEDEIPETGFTLRENAFLKANYLYNLLQKNGANYTVIADDSGLEVEALSGAPGVFSARYAGTPKNDLANNQKLVSEMSKVTKRQARFITVIALIDRGQVHYFEGEVKGSISYAPRGIHGFGYDPLFIPRGYRSTFAELGSEVKNSISHRAASVQKLIAFLSQDPDK